MNNAVKVFSLAFLFLIAFVGGVLADSRFVDNQDGTIVDNSASLMWQNGDDGVERTWSDAAAYCEKLNLAGYDDWFLPKIHELEGLIDSSYSPTVDPLFKVKPSYYWSASESRNTSKSAKYVNFFYGNTYAFSKDNTYYTMCARNFAASVASPLSVSIETKVSPGEAPVEVGFLSKITGGSEPYFYEWDFDDGNFSGQSNPTHTYEENGLYKIILTISDNDGSIAVSEQDLVLPAPKTEAEVVKDESDVRPAAEVEKKEPPSEAEEGQGMVLPMTSGDAQEAVVTDKIEEAVVAEDQEVGSEGSNLLAGVEREDTVATVLATVEEKEGQTLGEEKELPVTEESPQGLDTIADGGAETESVEEQAAATVLGSAEDAAEDAAEAVVEEMQEVAIPLKTREPAEGGAPISDQPSEESNSAAVAEADQIVSEEADFSQSSEGEQSRPAGPEKISGFIEVFASKGPDLVKGPAVEQGLLSYSFVNALNGDADWNKDGKVTAHELKGYLSIVIDNLSGGRQESVINNSTEDFPLCAEQGDTYIVTVAVDGSWDEEVAVLDFAEASAGAVAKIMSEKCPSWKQLQLSGSNATRNNIYRALLEINQKVGEADTFIFYFAGNSTKSPAGLALSTYDTVAGIEGLTGIDLKELNLLFRNIPAANKIMMYETAPK